MEHFKFYQNTQCEYFPCHENVAPEDFNCLFCYCPLYALADRCGGDFEYLSNGVKSCVNCTKPHGPGSYEHVMSHISDVIEKGKL